MDLNQRKLNKSEWNSIEIPVSSAEMDVLNLITKGFHDINIRNNKHDSIFSFLKIEYSTNMEDYLYNKYLSEKIKKIFEKYQVKTIQIDVNPKVQIKGADKIRLEKNDEKKMETLDLYEYTLLEHIEKIIKYNYDEKKYTEKNKYEEVEKAKNSLSYHYFTLFKLIKNNIQKINRHIIKIVETIIEQFKEKIEIKNIIDNAVPFIERNESLLKYGDMILYEHQKEIFTIFKNNTTPKLVLYIAPTGTGKTLTPIALSEKYRVLFVCAARHVGLALARAAISIHKKVAFAFGCASADDIRLHYFAAKVFTKNKKSGGIGKVDNSVGDDVEIMICDIKSYLPAMYYMKAFNENDKLIVYWDEPTITLDYDTHEFHSIIKENWKNNLIENMVLSSATLPKLHELTETIADFKDKFPNAEIHNIVSHDCKKSIPIINKDGFVVLPHYLNENYEDVLKIAVHCENNLTLLRYFDLKEVVDFISYVNNNNFATSKGKQERYFESLDDITMTNIKIYYLKLLQNIIGGTWGAIYTTFKSNRTQRLNVNNTVDTKGNKITNLRSVRSIGPGVNIGSENGSISNSLSGTALSRLASLKDLPSSCLLNTKNITTNTTTNSVANACIYVTTKDAYTLTDGPTIFISNDIEKIAKFCIQQANIPSKVMDDLMEKIEYNNVLNEKLNELEKELEYINEQMEKNLMKEGSNNLKKGSTKDFRKLNRETTDDTSNKTSANDSKRIANDIENLRSLIKSTSLNEVFVPNKNLHLKKWAEDLNTTGAFTSNIEESIVNEIMLLHGVQDSWKVLLMMGIGVFTNHENITYTEIMKKMADEQRLYMIIASSDYIYGTNYQFCHSYISKDLNLTQEKIIQAMGRIGRNNIQQNYTIRFRDDDQILKIFTSETDKPEIINMNRLFNSKNVVWDTQDQVYRETSV
jgi:hypothetical protein